jgi:hypothetical protein
MLARHASVIQRIKAEVTVEHAQARIRWPATRADYETDDDTRVKRRIPMFRIPLAPANIAYADSLSVRGSSR